MDDLITWLKVQLDEDERVAKATTGGGLRWFANGPNDIRTMPEGHRSELDTGEPFWFQVASKAWRTEPERGEDFEHIVRHGPARVLRDVKAKRELLELHPCAGADIGEPFCATCTPDDDLYSEGLANRWPCRTLRLLAAGYDTEPGYQEAWRP